MHISLMVKGYEVLPKGSIILGPRILCDWYVSFHSKKLKFNLVTIYKLSSSFPHSSNTFMLAMLRVLQASSGSGGDTGRSALPFTSCWTLGAAAADPIRLMESVDEGATLRIYQGKFQYKT
jgi:hypothetical protein